MITVFNVGQGDSILLKPDFDCCFYDVPLLIDCGKKSRNVHLNIIEDKIDVLITHSHSDHIGGLQDVLTKVRRLFIPYYLPEIWKIYTYLAEYLFENVVVVNLLQNNFENVIIVGEGDRLCFHSEVLNPPKWPKAYYNKFEGEGYNIEEALSILRNNGIQLPEEEIINFSTDLTQVENVAFGIFENTSNLDEYSEMAKIYVHNFFISLAVIFSEYGKIDINKVIQRKFQRLMHRNSIVFKYHYLNRGDVLFTGDADEYVFERLITKGTDIKADYLKVPHHGSKENLSLGIIKAINPKMAIFSHENGRFGQSEDTHPNIEVLDYFESLGIEMCFTNNVIKGGPTKYVATIGLQNEFIDFMQP